MRYLSSVVHRGGTKDGCAMRYALCRGLEVVMPAIASIEDLRAAQEGFHYEFSASTIFTFRLTSHDLRSKR